MTYLGDFYSKAGPIKQGLKLSSLFWMHNAEMYDQNSKDNSKMKVYTGLGLSVRESWKYGDINGAS